MEMEAVLAFVVVALTLVGLIGTVLPAFPGTWLIFAVALGYGWLTGFAHPDGVLLWWMAGMAVLAQGIDLAVSAVSVRLSGASKQAMVGAAVGALLGAVVFGPIGVLLGPFLGAFAVELALGKGLLFSGRAGAAAGLGVAFGLVVEFLIGVVMAFLLIRAVFQ